MQVNEKGTGYTLFIQNDKYANMTLRERENEFSLNKEERKELHEYVNKIIDSIPELKEFEESGGGIGVYILPEGTSKTVTDAVDTTTQKMKEEGTDENLLRAVLGVVKDNHEFRGDKTEAMGVTTYKADYERVDYDMEALNNVLDKFKDIYMNDGEVSGTFSKFKEYLNEVYHGWQVEAGRENPIITVDSTFKDETKNDLVDTLTAELDKGEDKDVDELKTVQDLMYEKFRKSIASSKITGKVFQQFG